MKISNFLLGLVVGITCCLFINATSADHLKPRFHFTWIGDSTVGIAYDAVTGKYVEVSYKQIKGGQSLEEFLK